MGWKDENQDILANLDTMSPDALGQLEQQLMDAFDEADKNNGSLADLNDISVAIQEVREAKESRTNDLANLRAQVHPVDETDGDDDNDDGEDDSGDDSPDEQDESDTDDTRSEPGRPRVPQEVAATSRRRPSISELQHSKGKHNYVPQVMKRVKTRLVAAGDIPGFGVGQEITSSEQLANALVRKLQALGRGGTPDDVLVASLVKEWPEERTLGEDPTVNDRRMAEILKPKNLVAYGGICEPVAVDYTIDTFGSTSRPLRDALPSFGATRGGVRFTPPPALSSITPPVPWTAAMDAAGTGTKACMVVNCGTPQEAVVYGIPVCLQVGNMMGRFSPEMVQAQSALLDVAAARTAELTLLQQIDTGSIAVTGTAAPFELGASRDVFSLLDMLISSYEYRYRLEDVTLRVVIPDWVHDMIRADVVKEMAHDTDGLDPRAVADAKIDTWFAARNCSPIWILEDLATSWKAQATGALNAWPATFVVYVFAEGTWQFLDGGTIDVGVVRDTTMNAQNNYQIWREDFEGIAKRGVESLKLTVTTAVKGASTGTFQPT